MQEVFEKIIKELEIERTTANNTFVKYEMNVDLGRVFGLEKAIEIVKQEAENYINGWIPCSSGRLPEENTDVEVTVEEIADDVGGKRYYNVRSWLQDGQWVIKKNPYNPTVIAWKYPTEPYQPKGE